MIIYHLMFCFSCFLFLFLLFLFFYVINIINSHSVEKCAHTEFIYKKKIYIIFQKFKNKNFLEKNIYFLYNN